MVAESLYTDELEQGYTTPGSSPLPCRDLLTDDSAGIFERYRALFALRNMGGEGAVEALGASFASDSALLKHEVAYVLGQMQNKQAVETLRYISRQIQIFGDLARSKGGGDMPGQRQIEQAVQTFGYISRFSQTKIGSGAGGGG